MSSPEIDPITPQRPRPDHVEKRDLHALMQIPGEARGSRSTSIVLSIILHAVIILALWQYVWIPAVERDVPVFQVFDLEAVPIEHPVPIEAPPVDETEFAAAPQPAVEPLAPRRIEPRDEDDAQPLFQPSEIPSTLPPPGAGGVDANANAPSTAGERLQRRIVDPALWVGPGTVLPGPLTPEEAAAGRLASGMKAFNDSVAAGLDAAERATDWTVKDKDGGRWGVSPGAIHIGSVTLPLPFQFSGPSGRREETADKVRAFAESNTQAKRLEMEATFESRAKALRARKNAERDSARAARARAGGSEGP